MDVLVYSDLDPSGFKKQFDRTVALLAAGDFRAADARKLGGTPYYRAKLGDADRLLFRFASFGGKTCLLMLEVIANHAYEKSRFLRGHARIDEDKLQPLARADDVPRQDCPVLPYVNPRLRHFHVLDKILSFDDIQHEVLQLPPPLILIGSAGSGKTVLTLEKTKRLSGDILYVTHSSFLVENARSLYYANGYENDNQEMDFLTFRELLETIEIPKGKPVNFAVFLSWFNRQRGATPIKDAHKLYEEFNGVLTGAPTSVPCLERDDYLGLGVRRSIFTGDERPHVYTLFQRYLGFLRESGHFDLNLEAFRNLARAPAAYDFAVVDEVQDLTNVQLMLILRHLRQPDRFILCGDSNQIVHPNFFSWANVKTMFYEERTEGRREITRILCANYRNSPVVTDLANRLLCIKHARFGSIDRESNYLVSSVGGREGVVELLHDDEKTRREVDRRTSRSARFAVMVLRPEDKADAARLFRTPLVFSVQEAKGLEYENIILCGLVSSAAREFFEITEGVSAADLDHDSLDYARARDKSDKALEALKFYINALYVAITRSVSNLYVLESNTGHRLFGLLGLRLSTDEMKVGVQSSTADEWKAEAVRLEKQGKSEQAEAIRRTILGAQDVPWEVLTPAALPAIEKRALDPANFNRQAKLLLSEYAVAYDRFDYLAALAALKFNPAAQPAQYALQVERKYSQDYQDKTFRELTRKVNLYGVDFRNPLNQTPLMIAARLGLPDLVRQLVRDGADSGLRDNLARTPLHLALHRAMQDAAYRRGAFVEIVQFLERKPLRLSVGDRLVPLEPHTMEHFLFSLLFAAFWLVLKEGRGFITAKHLETVLSDFPNSLLPEYRGRRAYISSILAKNEIQRLAMHNRQLLIRVWRGKYFLNPLISLEVDGEWRNVYDLAGVPAKDDPALSAIARNLVNVRTRGAEFIAERLAAYGCWRLERDAARREELAGAATEQDVPA